MLREQSKVHFFKFICIFHLSRKTFYYCSSAKYMLHPAETADSGMVWLIDYLFYLFLSQTLNYLKNYLF